jgi:hypothetical protein
MGILEHQSSSEIHCKVQTERQLKSKLELMDELLTFYNNLIEKQNRDESDIQLNEFAIMLIHVRILKISICNVGLLKKGHYNEFQSLLRDVYELVFLSQYLIEHPEKAEFWFDGNQINHRTIANSLKLPEEMRQIYASLCDYTHPNMRSVFKHWTLSKRQHEFNFYLISIFQRKVAKKLIILQLNFIFIGINQFSELFKRYQNFDKGDEKQYLRIKNKIAKLENAGINYCFNLKNCP